MESKSFPSNFDIAGRYAKHREQYDLRYGERGLYNLQWLNVDLIMSKTKGGVGYRIVSRNLTKLRPALHLNMKGGYKG